jgi:hypothetical protein
VTKRGGEQRLSLRVVVLDCDALSLGIRGDRKVIARLDVAARAQPRWGHLR